MIYTHPSVKRNLPPLLALRAFEAAGRHLSFSRAADELFVTQGAVSRHIKALEGHLKVPLFRRLTRRVELTPFGKQYLAAISGALEDIERASQTAVVAPKTTLTVSIMQTTASTLVMPRLASFTETYSDVDVHVVTSMQAVDFEKENVDLAIRLGSLPGRRYRPEQPQIPHQMVVSWKGVRADYLWDEILTPVCSRKLLAAGAPLKKPEDLGSYTLIHVAARPTAWPDWFRAMGKANVRGRGRLEFGHFLMALQAARHHRGVAIAPTLHIDNLDWRDELVCPFDPKVKSAGGYYLLCRERDANLRKVRLFRKWLLSQSTAPKATTMNGARRRA